MFKRIQQSAILLSFVIITLIGIIIYYLAGKNSTLWDLLSAIDTAVAVALGILAFFGYLEYTRSQDQISLFFNTEGKETDTGLVMLRKDVTRSEILGLLGMIQQDTTGRFDISCTKNPEFLHKLIAIQTGKQKKNRHTSHPGRKEAILHLNLHSSPGFRLKKIHSIFTSQA